MMFVTMIPSKTSQERSLKSTLFNPLLNNKTLDNLKTFADEFNFAIMTITLFDRVENMVEKGKKMVTSIFSFSHRVFQSFVF